MASQGHGGGGEADDSIQTGSSVAAVALLLLRALWIAGQEVADPEIWATGRTEAGGKRTEARGVLHHQQPNRSSFRSDSGDNSSMRCKGRDALRQALPYFMTGAMQVAALPRQLSLLGATRSPEKLDMDQNWPCSYCTRAILYLCCSEAITPVLYC